MTYGRARLWLGITGVGSLVTITTIALIWKLPYTLLEGSQGLSPRALQELVVVAGLFMVALAPLDFLGGYWLPKKFAKSQGSFRDWFARYCAAASTQAALFILFGSIIVLVSQAVGTVGGVISIGLLMIACFLVRNQLIRKREIKTATALATLHRSVALIQSWTVHVPEVIVVAHRDVGFTGGIIGLGKSARIVIPQSWLSFRTEELATAIARRSFAVSSGSYHRGLLAAFAWNLVGILICSLLPGADLASVAGLVTTMCGFTLWSFVGLLILPTASRHASLQIDQMLGRQGVPFELISDTASAMDQLQDGEPERPPFIEAIFHPVPSVKGRTRLPSKSGFAAWNVARTTLFLSWACLGLLARAVHCNVGRPELWTMLPTD